MKWAIQLAIGLICLSLTTVCAQDGGELPATLKQFITNDTIGIGDIDLEKIKLDGLIDWAIKSGAVNDNEETQIKEWAAQHQKVIDKIRLAGVRHAYAVFVVADLFSESMLIVMPLEDPEKFDAAVVEETLRDAIRSYETDFREVVVRDGVAIVGDTKDRILEYLKLETAKRPEVVTAWKSIKGSQIGLAVVGNDRSREVIRQLFPPLPEPFQEMTGEMIADDVQWISVGVDIPPETNVRVTVDTTGESTANKLSELFDEAKKLMQTLPVQDEVWGAAKEFASKVTATTNGNRMHVNLEEILADEGMQKVLGGVIRDARVAAQDTQRINNIKQLYLAMLNYESANQKFPAVATFDGGGKPLLSWRVQILPYLEGTELYERFRHDEPWNSEHNLKLVKEMPSPFEDPANPDLNAAGKTRFQLPYGEGCFLEGKERLQLKTFTDGTSRTVSIVRVNADKAVPWTKPQDWEVDAADPWKGVRPTAKDGKLIAGMSDGSVHRYSQEMKADVLLKILTRNGGEIVERDEIK